MVDERLALVVWALRFSGTKWVEVKVCTPGTLQSHQETKSKCLSENPCTTQSSISIASDVSVGGEPLCTRLEAGSVSSLSASTSSRFRFSPLVFALFSSRSFSTSHSSRRCCLRVGISFAALPHLQHESGEPRIGSYWVFGRADI